LLPQAAVAEWNLPRHLHLMGFEAAAQVVMEQVTA
jgi:hypothetical protein